MSNTETYKNTFQDCNINFLIGSGLSRPFLPTLGDIESLLTDLATRDSLPPDTAQLIRASIYKKYFDAVIQPNQHILSGSAASESVRGHYRTFLKSVNTILLKRKTTILSKAVNLFTTNIDLFLDTALEDLSLEYNDGFSGRFKPKFNLSNFKKAHFTKSSHYDNTAELPVFNLLKLHGSLSWAIEAKDSIFSSTLAHVEAIGVSALHPDHSVGVPDGTTVDALIASAVGKTSDGSTTAFLKAYEELLIVVNPTKDKFRHTLMNQTYYELLRLYANELEKENTVLFAMGFSFADEHICDITMRAAMSNPTLTIYIIAHSGHAKAEIDARLGAVPNNNVIVISPDRDATAHADVFAYDLENINSRIFGAVLKAIAGGDPTPGPTASGASLTP